MKMAFHEGGLLCGQSLLGWHSMRVVFYEGGLLLGW